MSHSILRRPFLSFRSLLRVRPFGSSHTPDTDVVGPGTRDPNAISTPYEISAGLERVELLAKLAGSSAFLMEPLKVDHYGTLKEPILVDSVVGRRLVGCTGFPKYSHEVLWFWVDSKEGPMRCQDCGQAFLEKLPNDIRSIESSSPRQGGLGAGPTCFQKVTPQDYMVESLVSGWAMHIQYVIQSIWLSLPKEYRERVGPLTITVEEPSDELLTSKAINLTLLETVYEKQREMLHSGEDSQPCNITLTYYKSVLIEKTATTKAELRVARQPAMGILHSINEIIDSLS
ncbi:hypothetical protein PSACC_02683 [Paramicrosporidium saccamoebae]|uniref:Uncharacterized protein n=1 Tax=Paramicrosporidium saccamoebae TaxID=1246581 RepID=A0A2H9TIC6_9FUNG|nr:hypothetical protein PSACC_02683 [Paramicrosporidium saccamoebae]